MVHTHRNPALAARTHFGSKAPRKAARIHSSRVEQSRATSYLYFVFCIHFHVYNIISYIFVVIIEGSLNRNFRQYGELKSSSRVVKSVDKRSNSQKVRRKKIRPRQMLEKSRNAVFFHRFVCRVSPKVGLLKRPVRRYVLRGDIKNCTPLWRKAHSQVKMCKTPQSRTTFGISDVEKLHAAVAKSTFGSENVKKLTIRDHFWKYRCWKIVRRCGEKHICKSKCTKHRRFGPLLEVQMSKNCTPLWRNAHLQVKMYKTP